MAEPRFHAEPDTPDAPDAATRWWVLDAETPGLIRAEFPTLPSDVVMAEELARETARLMNLWHASQVERARQVAVIHAWVDDLDGSDRNDLCRAIQEGGNNTLRRLVYRVLDQ